MHPKHKHTKNTSYDDDEKFKFDSQEFRQIFLQLNVTIMYQ